MTEKCATAFFQIKKLQYNVSAHVATAFVTALAGASFFNAGRIVTYVLSIIIYNTNTDIRHLECRSQSYYRELQQQRCKN
jgi:hypothetical protein